jgi:hypothetical protein
MYHSTPYKGRGFRRKAHVEYLQGKGDARNSWDVRIRVELETNESFKGLDLRYAEWKPAPDDSPSAQRILQFARSILGGGEFEVGPERQSPLDGRRVPPTLEDSLGQAP